MNEAVQSSKPVCLFLECVPRSMVALNVEAEINATGLQLGDHLIKIAPVVQTRVDTLLRAVKEHDPSVLHFSGHGSDRNELANKAEGVLFIENKDHKAVPLTAQLLDDLLGTDAPKLVLVVLNACHSESFATELMRRRASIRFVLGTKAAISDHEAEAFSEGLYRALAEGKNLDEAFKKARARATIEAPDQEAKYVLHEKTEGTAIKFILVKNKHPPPFPFWVSAVSVVVCVVVLIWLSYYPPPENGPGATLAILVAAIAAGSAVGTLVHGRIDIRGTVMGLSIDATLGAAAALLMGYVAWRVTDPDPDGVTSGTTTSTTSGTGGGNQGTTTSTTSGTGGGAGGAGGTGGGNNGPLCKWDKESIETILKKLVSKPGTYPYTFDNLRLKWNGPSVPSETWEKCDAGAPVSGTIVRADPCKPDCDNEANKEAARLWQPRMNRVTVSKAKGVQTWTVVVDPDTLRAGSPGPVLPSLQQCACSGSATNRGTSQ